MSGFDQTNYLRSLAVDLGPVERVLLSHPELVALPDAPRHEQWWQMYDLKQAAVAVGCFPVPPPGDLSDGLVGVQQIGGEFPESQLPERARRLASATQLMIGRWWGHYFGRYVIGYIGEDADALRVSVSAPFGYAQGLFGYATSDAGDEAIMALVVICKNPEFREALLDVHEELVVPARPVVS